ncbi:MAG: N-dimethylarginine dimethylaminohydrolase [Promicromonosporaceae bacterium]|nr:N-dimethylarginine dimethylaminohydrolase [Promicromonosporaceae bacterium]
MCPPTHFDVVYAINPWMDLAIPVDQQVAMQQWEALKNTYETHGHNVFTIDGEPGLPDMIYAANGGLVINGKALAPRFTYPEREAEGAAFGRWFEKAARAGLFGDGGEYLGQADEFNEGEGDLLLVGNRLLCGTGFRTSRAAHQELAERFGLAEAGIEIESLELVDPRFYHLDTALTVLDDGAATGEVMIAYFPAAFSPASQARLAELYPSAILADESDAAAFGLNAVSDGRRVYLNSAATSMMTKLRAHGFEPIGLEMSEILKGGGSVKCCSLVLRPAIS